MITEITDAQWKRLYEIRDEWIAHALSTITLGHDETQAIIDRFMIEVMCRTPVPVVCLDSPLATWWATLALATLGFHSVHSAVDSAVDSGKPFTWPYCDGFWWAGYFAWADAIAALGVNGHPTAYNAFRDVAMLGYVYPLRDVVVVSGRPTEIHRNGHGLHRDGGGMALSYADGWGFYALNGVQVPNWLATNRAETIAPKRLLEIGNAEVRREFVRKVGIDRICYKLGAQTLDKSGDYELLTLDLGDGEHRPYLKMLNPSIGTWHVEGVARECRTVEHALKFRKPEAMRQVPVDDENGADWFQQGDVCVWPRSAKALKSRPAILT